MSEINVRVKGGMGGIFTVFEPLNAVLLDPIILLFFRQKYCLRDLNSQLSGLSLENQWYREKDLFEMVPGSQVRV